MQMPLRFRRILLIGSVIVITGVYTSYAGCNCGDWMEKGGYCVDYVKEKNPLFPIPFSSAEILSLKNKEISEVTEDDVAIFNISNYWHVAYVEKVHRNQQGVASAIDVSEMNFGDQISFDEFKSTWKSKDEGEWRRAICCGITDKYDQMSFRKKVPLNSVTQIWSPVAAAVEGRRGRKESGVVHKVREVLNRLFDFKVREL